MHKRDKCLKVLRESGYIWLRTTGGHAVFQRPGAPILVLPIHQKEFSPNVVADVKRNRKYNKEVRNHDGL